MDPDDAKINLVSRILTFLENILKGFKEEKLSEVKRIDCEIGELKRLIKFKEDEKGEILRQVLSVVGVVESQLQNYLALENKLQYGDFDIPLVWLPAELKTPSNQLQIQSLNNRTVTLKLKLTIKNGNEYCEKLLEICSNERQSPEFVCYLGGMFFGEVLRVEEVPNFDLFRMTEEDAEESANNASSASEFEEQENASENEERTPLQTLLRNIHTKKDTIYKGDLTIELQESITINSGSLQIVIYSTEEKRISPQVIQTSNQFLDLSSAKLFLVPQLDEIKIKPLIKMLYALPGDINTVAFCREINANVSEFLKFMRSPEIIEDNTDFSEPDCPTQENSSKIIPKTTTFPKRSQKFLGLVNNSTHYYTKLHQTLKLSTLTKLSLSNHSTIIFANPSNVETIKNSLRKLHFVVSITNNEDLKPKLRNFKRGIYKILVCTDFLSEVCLLGASLVVNFDFPKGVGAYKERACFANRWKKKDARIISFVTSDEEMQLVREIGISEMGNT